MATFPLNFYLLSEETLALLYYDKEVDEIRSRESAPRPREEKAEKLTRDRRV